MNIEKCNNLFIMMSKGEEFDPTEYGEELYHMLMLEREVSASYLKIIEKQRDSIRTMKSDFAWANDKNQMGG